jgi:hypothetical protein
MIEIETIERYVDQVLEVNGFCKGDKEQLRQLLHHLYTAATIFHLMTDEQRALIGRIQTELSAYFVTKIVLKERKRKERQRKNPLNNPLIKEKETKEKDEKTLSRAARREAFHQECLGYVGLYDTQELSNFFNYWSEENTKTGKMRYEDERHWNTERRLKRWVKNQYSSANTAAELRLEKAKKGKARETTNSKQQQAIAAQRERENEEREAQQQENKEKAVSLEEYAKLNPDSTLARMFTK